MVAFSSRSIIFVTRFPASGVARALSDSATETGARAALSDSATEAGARAALNKATTDRIREQVHPTIKGRRRFYKEV